MIISNNLYTHTSGRISLPQFQMFGFVLLALGVYLLINSIWFGTISIIVGFALFFAIAGIQIDFEKKHYREFIGLLSFKYGKWIKLPHIEYVTVFPVKYAQRGSVASIDNVRQFSKVKVSLIVSKTKRIEAGSFNEKPEAFEAGKLIARKLNTKLLDYTSKEPKWIHLNNDETK